MVEWTEGNTAFLSVVFTWDLPKAYQRAVWLSAEGYDVRAGGPAVLLMPDYLSNVARINGDGVDALPHHNPNATFTSRGCIRKCKFCAVPKIEGDLVELDQWSVRPIVFDNNLLACSQRHFDLVIDSLLRLTDIDFNQGLDARLLSAYHADRLAQLKLSCVRLAWDHISEEPSVLRACDLLIAAGIPSRLINVYVLIGFDDDPESALYRLQTLKNLGYKPFPMRYQPLDTLRKNSYIAESWTQNELARYMKYWARQAYLSGIPFEQFRWPPSAF